MTGRCEGQRWLVTGATRGLGRELVVALAREGARVVACGRRIDGLDPVGGEGQVRYVEADVGNEGDVERLFDVAVDALGGLDVVVNNAGITHDGLLVETSLDQWERVLATNVRGPYLVMRRAIEEFLGDGGGCIVNVSSAAANGLAGGAAYAASKSALLSMSRAVAKEYGPRNIRCNAVVPGFFTTDMTAGLDPARARFYADLSPERRFGQPDELVEAVLFLASADAAFVTGDALWVCGAVADVPRMHAR